MDTYIATLFVSGLVCLTLLFSALKYDQLVEWSNDTNAYMVTLFCEWSRSFDHFMECSEYHQPPK